jgi:predicted ATP-grasp superfamily ATP-dependent carboligase
VIAADSFCDVDLQRWAQALKLDPNPLTITQEIRYLVDLYSPEAVVLGPGLEELAVKGVRLLNNPPEKASLVSDKLWLSRWLEQRGYPSIPTWLAGSQDKEEPRILKPRKGGGGQGCRLLREGEKILPSRHLIVQEVVDGMPASVSVIANGTEAKALAANEQLIGCPWLGAQEFRYCGNITPLQTKDFIEEMTDLAVEVVARLGLVGSNGVDFILTKDGPVVVEVNPRFQGSLDTVELSTGINVFQAHLQSFDGILPRPKTPSCFAGRAILYAEKNLQIERDLGKVAGITDIPSPGSHFQEGDPIASMLVSAKEREETLRKLKEKKAELRQAFKER